MSNILKGLQLNELSNEKLGQYKKAAGADAKKADSEGDYKRGDKRFSGIVKATKKQFANDEKQLKEFAPVGGDDREPDEEEILRQLAAQWFNGDEDPRAEKTLAAMGWEIGYVESGDDDAGVFLIRSGDINGDTYIAFNQSDLELNETFNNYHANRTGFSRGQRDDERHDLDVPAKQEWALKINGKVWSKDGKAVTFSSREQALKARQSILSRKPELEVGLVTRNGVAEDQLDELKCWSGYHRVVGTKAGFPGSCAKNKTNEEGVAEGWQEESQDLEDWSKEVNKRLYRAHESQRPALARQLSKLEQKNFGSSLNKGSLTELVHSALMAIQKGNMVHYDPQSVGSMPFGNIVGDDARVIANSGLKKYDVDGYRGLKRAGIVDTIEQFLHLRDLADNQGQAIMKYANMPPVAAWMQFIKDIGWSKDDMNEEVQAKTDDKLLAYYAQRKAEKEKQQQGVVKEQHSCPHCGGEMVSEELMNEKKDACYYKVKSRYKVWPSAYASGALVKCRKKGADSWGNGGKKNESSILEGLERADESLHDWFNKEKWVRMDTKGNIKGPCAREPGEGKPKCLPQAKAHSLGKKGRASAAQRKRREDPNPDRSGKAINVNTKKKSNEGVAEGVRDLGYDAQSLIMKLRRDVEEKRLQPTPQAVLAAARELAGDMDFAPQLLVKQVLGQGVAEDQLDEKWSQKYKNSINCSNPKGFSQKAHCQGKNK
jgi:hypothetical protein